MNNREKSSLDRALAGGIAWNATAKVVGQVAAWVSTLYVARVLAPDDFGVVTMAMVVVTFLGMLGEFGIGAAVIQHRDLDREQLEQLHLTAFGLGLLCGSILLAVSFPVGMFFRSEQVPRMVAVMSLTIVFSSLRTVPLAVLQRDLKFKQSAGYELAQSLCVSGLSALLAFAGLGYWTLVFSNVFGAALQSALVLYRYPIAFRRPEYSRLSGLIGFSRDTLTSRLAWYLFQDADFFVAGRILGKSALGAYSFAWTIASVPVEKITATLATVLMPVFSAVQSDRDALRRYLCISTELLAAVAMPASVGLLLCAPELVRVGLGSQWEAAIFPLRVLAGYSAIRSLLPILSHAIVALGDTRFVALNSLLTAGVMPIAFLVGTRWGINGVALAWIAIHPLVGAIPLGHRALNKLEIPFAQYWRALRPAITSTAGMVGSVLLFAHLFEAAGDKTILALKIFAGAVSYCALIVGFFGNRLRSVRLQLKSR